MLLPAYLHTTNEAINRLISEGNYKYLALASYMGYEDVDLKNDEWEVIQRVSKDNNDNILGYFEAQIDQSQNKITGTYFVKFRYTYEISKEKIVDKDFNEFIDMIMNHPIYDRVMVKAVAENPANKTYEKWLDEYNGEVFTLSNYARLQDGKYYDVNLYWFDRRR